MNFLLDVSKAYIHGQTFHEANANQTGFRPADISTPPGIENSLVLRRATGQDKIEFAIDQRRAGQLSHRVLAFNPPSDPTAEDATKVVTPLLSNIKKLQITDDIGLTNEGLEALLKSLEPSSSDLVHLDLSGYTALTGKQLDALLKACPNLASINAGTAIITEDLLFVIAKNCPNLTSIVLPPYISNNMILVLRKYCPNLTSIDLSQNRPYLMEGSSTTEIMTSIAKSFPNLTEINLTGLWHLPESDIEIIVQNCSKLTSIELVGCHRITDSTIYSIAQNCPNLKSISIKGVTAVREDAIIEMLKKCHKLTAIDIRNSGANHRPLFAMIQYCPHLTSILCSSYGNDEIKALARKYPRLQEIDLSNRASLNDEALTLLAERCHDLRMLLLNSTNTILTITEGAIIQLLSSSKEMRHLELVGLSITDQTIAALATHCPKLTHLNLFRCKNIRGNALHKLALLCPAITKIHLGDCTALSKNNVKYLLFTMPSLELITVRNNLFSDAEIIELKAKHPNIDIRIEDPMNFNWFI